MKKSFILYCDSLAILKDLNNQQAGMLFKAIAAYHNNEAQVLPTELSLVFILFKNQFERDENKWQEIKSKRVVAGAKGGKQKVANATKGKQKPPVSVNDNVTVNVNDNKNVLFSKSVIFEKIKFKEAFPEWSKEKLAYYYDAVLTWSNEGNKKKDWIATVRTWAARDEKQGKIKFNVVTYSSAAHDGIL